MTKWSREVSYIRKNFRNELAIADLIQVSGLNHRKLHRGFVELFGVAPMQFITRTRIEAACDDLLTTSKSFRTLRGKMGFMIKVPSLSISGGKWASRP